MLKQMPTKGKDETFNLMSVAVNVVLKPTSAEKTN